MPFDPTTMLNVSCEYGHTHRVYGGDDASKNSERLSGAPDCDDDDRMPLFFDEDGEPTDYETYCASVLDRGPGDEDLPAGISCTQQQNGSQPDALSPLVPFPNRAVDDAVEPLSTALRFVARDVPVVIAARWHGDSTWHSPLRNSHPFSIDLFEHERPSSSPDAVLSDWHADNPFPGPRLALASLADRGARVVTITLPEPDDDGPTTKLSAAEIIEAIGLPEASAIIAYQGDREIALGFIVDEATADEPLNSFATNVVLPGNVYENWSWSAPAGTDAFLDYLCGPIAGVTPALRTLIANGDRYLHFVVREYRNQRAREERRKAEAEQAKAAWEPEFLPPWSEDTPLDEMLVPNMIPRAGVGVLSGPSTHGKTFVALDIAARLAAGVRLDGSRSALGLVVYITGEGKGGFGKRVEAVRQRYGLVENGPLRVITKMPDFRKPEQIDALMASIETLKQQTGLPLLAVIVDTVKKALHDGDDSNARDVGALQVNGGRIRDRFNASVVFIHHPTKDGSSHRRGHSSLFDDSDFCLWVHRTKDGVIHLTTEKQKDGPDNSYFGACLEPVTLMRPNGSVTTTCIVQWLDTTGAAKAEPQNNEAASKTAAHPQGTALLSALDTCLARNPIGHIDSGGREVVAARLAEVRATFDIFERSGYDITLSPEDQARENNRLRMRWKRTLDPLLENGTLASSGSGPDALLWRKASG